MPKLLFLSGSERQGSFSKKILDHAAQIAQDRGANVTVIDIKDYTMPIYSADFEKENGSPPASAVQLKQKFIQSDGFLFSSPEYNGCITPLLKNTIDWVSRPVDGIKQSPFKLKTASICSASVGALGGIRCLIPLRAMLQNIGMITLPTQLAIPNATSAFDENGKITAEFHLKLLNGMVSELVDITSKIYG